MALFGKLKNITAGLFGGFTEADEAFFDELEEALILSDAGVECAVEAVDRLRKVVRRDKMQDPEEIRWTLRVILEEMMSVGDPALDLSTAPSIVLFIGVNGVGKTTTIGKLAYTLKREGKRVLLCAADTFRAAAAD
ncbi:MAG: signal recognition particle receptor subunit alpha, partial [Oscillibacter sp.]|nr:signal recognition particle receptor subunit alpha [Oscillibacter sp.]